MKWRDAVLRAIADELSENDSDSFTREELLRSQLPKIVRLTGAVGSTPEQTTSRILQELRDDGVLVFSDRGLYRVAQGDVLAHLALQHPFNHLDVGMKYTRAEIAPLALAYGYGKLTAGITPKGTFPATESVVVFADVGAGRYGNFWDEETGDLIYVGEDDSRTFGKDAGSRDQSHTKGKNRVLTHQRELGHPIFLFTREDGDQAFTYRGLVDVASFDYYLEGSRRVVRYRLRCLGVSSAVVDFQMHLVAQESIKKSMRKPPRLEEPQDIRETTVLRRYRSRVFSQEVRESYQFACAVCGAARYNYKEDAEVDAAHIYPVARRGSNDVRNGMALCKFHHWAFDGHLFFVTPMRKIVPTLCGIEVSGIKEFDGEPLMVLPRQEEKAPHPLFLREREKLVPRWLLQPA